jgi:hypothetical protein
VPLLVTLGTEKMRLTLDRDGISQNLQALGAQIGSTDNQREWERVLETADPKKSVLTSYQAPGEERGGGEGGADGGQMCFVASPALVTVRDYF